MRKRYCGPTIYERVIRPRWLWTTMVMKSPPHGPHCYLGNKTSLGFHLAIPPSAFVIPLFYVFWPSLVFVFVYLHSDPAKTSIPRRHDQLTAMSADSEGESQRHFSTTTTPDDALCWFLVTCAAIPLSPLHCPMNGVSNWKRCLLTLKEKLKDFYFSTTTTPDGAFCWFLITIALT